MNSLDLWENIVRASIRGKYLGMVLTGKYPYSGELEYNSINTLFNSKERLEAEDKAFGLFTQICDELLGTEGIAPKPVAEMCFDTKEALDKVVLSAQLIQGLRWVTRMDKSINCYCITFTFDMTDDPNVTPAQCYKWLYEKSDWGKEKREAGYGTSAEQYWMSHVMHELGDILHESNPVTQNLLEIVRHHEHRAETNDMFLVIDIKDLETSIFALAYINKNFFLHSFNIEYEGVSEDALLRRIDYLNDDNQYTKLLNSGEKVRLGDRIAYPLTYKEHELEYSCLSQADRKVTVKLSFDGKY